MTQLPASVTIPDLPTGTTPAGTEPFESVQGGNSVQLSATQILDTPVLATGTSTARSLPTRLAEALNVKDFGAIGDGVTDDAPAFQAAADYIASRAGQLVEVPTPASSYLFKSPVTISGDWFAFRSTNGATITNGIAGYAAIDAATTADTSIPDASNPGPMRGCAFYFTSLINYSLVENITFSGFRFALAYLGPHNSPILRNVNFNDCNCGVFYYQSTQNPKLVNCGGSSTNVIWISSATCFPSGSTYAGQDNVGTDGLAIENDVDGYNAFGGCPINADFDTWFVASVLRPSVISVWVAASDTYRDGDGTTYADNDRHCLPSGRIAFIPFRNVRNCFGFRLSELDIRGPTYNGLALVNTTVFDFVWQGFNSELQYDGSQPSATTPIVEVGSIQDGATVKVNNAISGNTSYNSHPLISLTGRGGFSSIDLSFHAGTNFTPSIGQQYYGLIGGTFHRQNERQFLVESPYTAFDARVGGAASFSYDFSTGATYSNNDKIIVADGIPAAFTTPVYDGAWHDDIGVTLLNDAAGVLEISVLNKTEAAWDYGEFYVESGSTVAETLTTAADLNNGDAYVAVTSAPSTTRRFTRFTVATGVQVVLDYYDATNKRIYVLGGIVTGLAATVTSGSSITRATAISTIRPFAREWVTPGFGITAYATGSTFGIRNNISVYTDGATKESLFVIVKFRSFPRNPEKTYAAAAPTTGSWARSAIVWNTAASASGFIGWVCTAAGTPGTWKTFGAISA